MNPGRFAPLGTSTLRKTRAAVALMSFFPFVSDAQLFDSGAAGKPRGQRAATQILRDAAPIWRKDSERESREDRNYWRDYRGKMKARLLGAERVRTARIISAARARAEAFGAFATRKQNGSPAPRASQEKADSVIIPQPDGWPTGAMALSQAAATAKRHMDAAATAAQNTAQSLARTIGDSLPAAKSPALKTASVILALLTIFLAPAALLTAAVFGLLRLRKRR